MISVDRCTCNLLVFNFIVVFISKIQYMYAWPVYAQVGSCPLFSCSELPRYVPSYKGVETSIARSNFLPPPCYVGKYTMPSPNRREELIAGRAGLCISCLWVYVFLLLGGG
jgi:hypothetical protein